MTDLSKITHVVFDVDGTMYEKDKEYVPGKGSIEDAQNFLRAKAYSLLRKYPGSPDTVARAAVNQYIKHNADSTIGKAIADTPKAVYSDLDSLIKLHGSTGNLFHNEFDTPLDYFSRILSYVDFSAVLTRDEKLNETIRYLKDGGLTLGILTNEVFLTIEKIASVLGFSIADFALDTGSEYPIFCKENGVAKPDPMSWRRMADLNRIPYGKILYVGDVYSKDIVPPLSLGMKAARVTHSGEGIVDKGDHLEIAKVYDLSKVL